MRLPFLLFFFTFFSRQAKETVRTRYSGSQAFSLFLKDFCSCTVLPEDFLSRQQTLPGVAVTAGEKLVIMEPFGGNNASILRARGREKKGDGEGEGISCCTAAKPKVFRGTDFRAYANDAISFPLERLVVSFPSCSSLSRE